MQNMLPKRCVGTFHILKPRALVSIEGLFFVVLTGLSPLTLGFGLHTSNLITVEAIQNAIMPYPGNTLISGRDVIELNSSTGDVVWIFDGKDLPGLISQSNPLDADRLKNGNTLITYFHGTLTPRHDYPEGVAGYPSIVAEISPEGNVVWNFSSGLDFCHDADRLDSGNTVIADSSPNIHNERILEVDSNGTIVWEYKTGYGSFPNDVDVLPSGNVLISLRDWNTIIEVNRQGEIIWTFNGTNILRKQHNPDLLWNDRLIVADSSHDRILEIDRQTGNIYWDYRGMGVGGLSLPRDADKLPSGGFLITDSRANRVVEVSQSGDLIWQYEVQLPSETMLYDADRLNVPPTIAIVSPVTGTYEVKQIQIILTSPDPDVSKMFYRIFNESKESWLDPTNITWTQPVFRSLAPGEYTIWAWATDSGDWTQGDPNWPMTSTPARVKVDIQQIRLPGFVQLVTWSALVALTIYRIVSKNKLRTVYK